MFQLRLIRTRTYLAIWLPLKLMPKVVLFCCTTAATHAATAVWVGGWCSYLSLGNLKRVVFTYFFLQGFVDIIEYLGRITLHLTQTNYNQLRMRCLVNWQTDQLERRET